MQDKAPIQIDFYHLKSDDIAAPLAPPYVKADASAQEILSPATEERSEAVVRT